MPTTYDPGQVNAEVYNRFRARFNRDPNEGEIGQFKSANSSFDWTKPFSQAQYNSALSWVDTYHPTPSPAPSTAAPTLRLGRLRAPNAFVPTAFVAPTADEILQDPGYRFGLDETRDAVINSASAGGLVRSPQGREALMRRIGDYATGFYNDAYQRRFNTWRENEAARERAHAANFGVDATVAGFNNDATIDEFDPQFTAWDRGEDRRYRDRVFDANEYWRRRDDFWRNLDMEESRRRFLASLGNS